jgi:NADH:ubiquinone oxidoreductase subunit 3 (subunit A)
VLAAFLPPTEAESVLGGCEEESAVSRSVLVVTALVVGAVLALGSVFATSALVSSSQNPSNQAPYNYGSN